MCEATTFQKTPTQSSWGVGKVTADEVLHKKRSKVDLALSNTKLLLVFIIKYKILQSILLPRLLSPLPPQGESRSGENFTVLFLSNIIDNVYTHH